MDKKKISFHSNLKMESMVKDIKDKNGFFTIAETIRYCIGAVHKKEFKDYLSSKHSGASMNKRDDKIAVCHALDGRIETENGKDYCIYYNYGRRDRFEQKKEVNLLTHDLLDRQYVPNKEKVKELQKQGKVNYEID